MDWERKLHNLLHPLRGEVWMLHRVVERRSDDEARRRLEVTPQWLEAQVKATLDAGWRFVDIAHAGQARRTVCLTFDDGYADTFTCALPVLKRLGVPFAVYVTTGFVDNALPMWWYGGEPLGLESSQLLQLAAEPLCTIGAHTLSHPRLATLPEAEQRHEVGESKRRLEALLKRPVEHFSYPHGSFSDATVRICRELGFRTAVTTSGRPLRTGADPLRLDRINCAQPLDA